MAKKVINLLVKEVALTVKNKQANRRKFIFYKSDEGGNMGQELIDPKPNSDPATVPEFKELTEEELKNEEKVVKELAVELPKEVTDALKEIIGIVTKLLGYQYKWSMPFYPKKGVYGQPSPTAPVEKPVKQEQVEPASISAQDNIPEQLAQALVELSEKLKSPSSLSKEEIKEIIDNCLKTKKEEGK